MRRMPILVLAAVLLTAFLAGGPALAGRVPRKNSPDQEQPKRPEGKGFGLAMPKLNENPVFQRAAEVPPRPPETYERVLPEQVAGYARKQMKGRTTWYGPAGTSVVRATYADPDGNTIRLELVDPGGIPPEASPSYRPFPEPGARESAGGRVREGLRVAGYAAAAETILGQRGGQLEVVVGPRLRLTLASGQVSAAGLREFAEALPLAQLAALAPEPTPDFSDILAARRGKGAAGKPGPGEAEESSADDRAP